MSALGTVCRSTMTLSAQIGHSLLVSESESKQLGVAFEKGAQVHELDTQAFLRRQASARVRTATRLGSYPCRSSSA